MSVARKNHRVSNSVKLSGHVTPPLLPGRGNTPVVRTIEGPLVGDIVDQQDAHGAPVVGGGDGAETLLARRVPDLQLDPLAIELDRPDLEVDADGGDEGRREGVLAEAQQAAGLAHARIANEQ